MRQIPYWPEIKISEGPNMLKYETIVRKLHEGVWYDNVIAELAHGPTPGNSIPQNPYVPVGIPSQFERDMMRRFVMQVHLVQNFGKVDLNIVNMNNEPIFKPSKDQTGEEERLIEAYPYLKGHGLKS